MSKLSNPILPTQGLTEPAQPTGPDIPFVPPSAAPVLPIDDWMTWEWLNFNKSFIINLFGDWTQNLTDLWTYKMTKILQFSRQIFRNMSKRKENRLLCAGLTIGQRGQWPSLSTDCSSSSESSWSPSVAKCPRDPQTWVKSDLETGDVSTDRKWAILRILADPRLQTPPTHNV